MYTETSVAGNSGLGRLIQAGINRREGMRVYIPLSLRFVSILLFCVPFSARADVSSARLLVTAKISEAELIDPNSDGLPTAPSAYNVKLTDALLGSDVNLKTLDGDIKVKIPEGVTHGEILRIKGKGVPYEKNSRGDILIKVHIMIPKKLSKDAKKLVESLKKEGI